MKVRIFTLAKELKLDSKELIALCNEAGVSVKSSALASITEAERDTVLAFLKNKDAGEGNSGSKGSSPSSKQDPLEPVRESKSGATSSRVRAMGGGPLSRMRAAAKGEPVVEETTENDSDVDTPGDNSTTEDTSSSTDVAAAEEQAPVAGEETPSTPVADSEPSKAPGKPKSKPKSSKSKTDSASDEDSKEEPTAGSGPASNAPVQRGDYVSSAGSAMSRVREMKPRASVSGSAKKDGGGQSKPKGKARPLPNLPTMAQPPSLPSGTSKPKSKDTPAQKPDLRLSADVLGGASPLAAHLKKHAEEKEKLPDDKSASGKSKNRLLSLSDSRAERRTTRNHRGGREQGGQDAHRRGRPVHRRRRPKRTSPIEYKSEVEIEFPISLRGLSEQMGRPAPELMKYLFSQGKVITINTMLDEDDALEISMEFGVDLKIKRGRNIEEELQERIDAVYDEDKIQTRPPVVTVLGHVDHGKTTLVDTIRSASVASGEAGGITQHIAAYQVEHDGKKVTFVDTPGHAAFGEMRARGANVTDIIVLVVAADDGVMPQTAECISHAKAAGVPIIVAMNKIDLPDVNEQKVLQDLAAQEILPVEWGGETEVVRVSALNNIGIDELLETILLTAEIHEYTAASEVLADGVCLEAFRDEGRGPLAWMIIRQGTLRVGDIILCGETYGRVRAMYNDADEEITEAPPSVPVKVAGLESVPGAGDHFFQVEDIETARELTEERIHEGRSAVLALRGGPKTLEEILGEGTGVKYLPVVLKADTPGSLEALRSEIEKFDHPEVRVKILHEGVGGVNESDVYLASASDAIIAAFHVIAEDRARVLAEKEGVEIRRYSIIYEVTADIRKGLEGLLEPEQVEVSTGRALVLATFDISRFGRIAGCRILSGVINRNNRVHVIRDQKILNNYSLASLKREKDDAKEVREGFECGIRLDGFNDIKEGDLLEAYRIDEVKRTLDSE